MLLHWIWCKYKHCDILNTLCCAFLCLSIVIVATVPDLFNPVDDSKMMHMQLVPSYQTLSDLNPFTLAVKPWNFPEFNQMSCMCEGEQQIFTQTWPCCLPGLYPLPNGLTDYPENCKTSSFCESAIGRSGGFLGKLTWYFPGYFRVVCVKGLRAGVLNWWFRI